MYLEAIDHWVEVNRRAILDLNGSLVSIPSENRYPHGDEKDVQRFVEGYLEELGCTTDTFLPTGDDPWSVDPFSVVVEDGKKYGLGIFDMKGGMAAAMMAMRALGDLGVRLEGDVTIETVVDEEFGGANGTLACRLRGYEADVAIVPEPSNLIICPQNQGGGMFRVTFDGKPGRSFSGNSCSIRSTPPRGSSRSSARTRPTTRIRDPSPACSREIPARRPMCRPCGRHRAISPSPTGCRAGAP
jgi:acetylornithine deacetylase